MQKVMREISTSYSRDVCQVISKAKITAHTLIQFLFKCISISFQLYILPLFILTAPVFKMRIWITIQTYMIHIFTDRHTTLLPCQFQTDLSVAGYGKVRILSWFWNWCGKNWGSEVWLVGAPFISSFSNSKSHSSKHSKFVVFFSQQWSD